MMKPALNSLAAAAALLLLGAQIASAGSDGTCAGTNLDQLAVTPLPDASAPVSSEAGDYTKVAEATAATRNAVAVLASQSGDSRDNASASVAKAPSSRQ
jgi:hypothetical protein